MDIAVLGCGPAGLVAADHLASLGHDVHVYSLKQKSVISGAQFMHTKIGWYCSDRPDHKVEVIKYGNGRGYASNVYNDPEARTSWRKFVQGTMYGWDMKLGYDRLWDKWEGRIYDTLLERGTIDELSKTYDMIFSSVPLRMICYRQHNFSSQDVLIIHGDGSPFLHPGINDNDMMLYNGIVYEEGGYPWYRFSQLNQYQSWEFSRHRWEEAQKRMSTAVEVDGRKLSTIQKPIETNCDCYPNVIKIGRYGSWDKEILTHHIPEKINDAIRFRGI